MTPLGHWDEWDDTTTPRTKLPQSQVASLFIFGPHPSVFFLLTSPAPLPKPGQQRACQALPGQAAGPDLNLTTGASCNCARRGKEKKQQKKRNSHSCHAHFK